MEVEGQKNRSLMRPIFLPEVKLIKQRSIEAVVSELPNPGKLSKPESSNRYSILSHDPHLVQGFGQMVHTSLHVVEFL